MSASAGRVLLLFKGDYSAGTTYVPMDCVYYNGGSYVCKAETTGNLPTNTTYWQVLAQKGGGDVPQGGTTGQIMRKASATDYDIEWVNMPTVDATLQDGSTNAIQNNAVYDAVDNIYKDNGVLGAKNLLQNKASTTTSSGVTFTINSDGSVTMNTDANGATAKVFFYLNGSNSDTFSIKKGTYILTTGDEQISGANFGIWEGSGAEQIEYAYIDTGDVAEFTVSSDTLIRYAIRVESGTVINNKTIYPMIRLASDPDDTYQPYAMTNQELTNRALNETSAVIPQFTDTTNYKNTGSIAGDSKYFIRNGICYVNLYITATTPTSDEPYVGATLPKPKMNSGFYYFFTLSPLNGNSVLFIAVRDRTSDNLRVSGGVAGVNYYGTFSYPVE